MLLDEVRRPQRQMQDQQQKLNEVEQLKGQMEQLARLNRTMQAAICTLLQQHELKPLSAGTLPAQTAAYPSLESQRLCRR
jgi:gamma-glutamyl:cysteine ligase YbdK (ATP-grasp superfamily)